MGLKQWELPDKRDVVGCVGSVSVWVGVGVRGSVRIGEETLKVLIVMFPATSVKEEFRLCR